VSLLPAYSFQSSTSDIVGSCQAWTDLALASARVQDHGGGQNSAGVRCPSECEITAGVRTPPEYAVHQIARSRRGSELRRSTLSIRLQDHGGGQNSAGVLTSSTRTSQDPRWRSELRRSTWFLPSKHQITLLYRSLPEYSHPIG
jgi:hypothetical protein